jgi:hypothetical protein
MFIDFTFQILQTLRVNHQNPRSHNHAEITQQIFCCSNGISGTDTQQHIKSALQAFVLNSLPATMQAQAKTRLQGFLSSLAFSQPTASAAA